MSWFRDLAQAYDNAIILVGIDSNLVPENHMTSSVIHITITIDGNGNFLKAEEHKGKDKLKIAMPATNESANRTNAPEAHPLHEQIGYIAKGIAKNKKKHEKYVSLLAKWSDYHPKIKAVETYVLSDHILQDLEKSGIELKKNQAGVITDEKSFVRFRVEIPGDLYPDLDKDRSVIEAWQRYSNDAIELEEDLCYVDGKLKQIAVNHPKGVNPSSGNAKIISANDKSGFTFRGRFKVAEQTNAIGATTTHKAHSMLKYLIQKQAYRVDTQAIVVFSVENGSKPKVGLFESSHGILGNFREEAPETEAEKKLKAKIALGQDCAQEVKKALSGYYSNLGKLKEKASQIAVLATDAATTGRLAITFYQKMPENQYFERISDWHESIKFWQGYKGEKKDDKWQEYAFISAPSADKIIEAVYGKPKGEGYNKIKKQAREKLLSNIVNGQPFDRAWMDAAVNRVSNPFSYDKSDGSWDMFSWQEAVKVTCAIVRKYFGDRREEQKVMLDKENRDRSYLFGRLLAIADRIETHARLLQGKIGDESKRPTNAVRYQTAFVNKPMRTWEVLYRQLRPYRERLGGAEWYQKQIDEITALLGEDGFNDRRLDGKYLLGYSLQRLEFYKKNDDNTKEEN